MLLTSIIRGWPAPGRTWPLNRIVDLDSMCGPDGGLDPLSAGETGPAPGPVNRAFTGPGGSAQAKDAARAMLHGSEDRWGVIKEGVKTKVQEFLPHSSE